MRTVAKQPVVATILGVAVLGSSLLLGGANPGDDLGQQVREVASQPLPRMNGERLEARIVEVTYDPGGHNIPHSHPCPVLGYVVEGEIRSQLDSEPERIYKAGDTFYEAPNRLHRVSSNASRTERARVIAVFVCDHAASLTIPIPTQRYP